MCENLRVIAWEPTRRRGYASPGAVGHLIPPVRPERDSFTLCGLLIWPDDARKWRYAKLGVDATCAKCLAKRATLAAPAAPEVPRG